MTSKKPHIDELEARLGYRFKEASLLREALTHASARTAQGGKDNERLEFLGDRVLGLSIAALLYAEFPEAREVEEQYEERQRAAAERLAQIRESMRTDEYGHDT